MSRIAQFRKNLQRFRLVTFDITDTILQFKRPPGEQYAETASNLGIKNIDQNRLSECFRQEFKTMGKEHPNFGRTTPNMTWQQWWIQLVKNIFRCVEPTIPDDRLQLLATTLLYQFRTQECWDHINGGKELIQKVRDAGKYVGVISNFDASLPQILREMQIDKKFDFVLTSYDSEAEKPDTKIFDTALQHCKVKPQEALHIGDTYEKDYVGARNSGWCSLLVTKKVVTVPNIHDTHVYTTLADMVNALETVDIKW